MNLREHIKETIKMAIPVSIGQLSHVMLGVVDSIMVGKIGAVPLAAASLVNSLLILVIILGIGMSIAITPLVAIANGSGKEEKCGIYLRQGLLVNMVFSILLFLSAYFFADLIKFMNQPVEVVEVASSYMKIVSFSIIPLMFFQSYKQFIEGLSFTKPGMFINIAANFINAFVNWLLIFGNWGFPELGLDGAGIATLSTRVFIAVVIFVYIIRSERFKKYDPSLRFRSIDFKIIRKIINIGLPTGMQMLFEAGVFSFAAIMIGWIGTVELAAHQIATNLSSITFMTVMGISAAATIRVGNALGRKDYEGVKLAGYSSIFIAASFMSISGLLFIIFREQLPLLYINDSMVVKTASTLLIIAAFYQISDGIQGVGIGVLRGMTDVKIPMFIAFFAYWIIAVPFGYIFGFVLDLGVAGVWVSLVTGLTIAAIFFTIRFKIKLKHILDK